MGFLCNKLYFILKLVPINLCSSFTLLANNIGITGLEFPLIIIMLPTTPTPTTTKSNSQTPSPTLITSITPNTFSPSSTESISITESTTTTTITTTMTPTLTPTSI